MRSCPVVKRSGEGRASKGGGGIASTRARHRARTPLVLLPLHILAILLSRGTHIGHIGDLNHDFIERVYW